LQASAVAARGVDGRALGVRTFFVNHPAGRAFLFKRNSRRSSTAMQISNFKMQILFPYEDKQCKVFPEQKNGFSSGLVYHANSPVFVLTLVLPAQ
jgi:hypothetical protein